MAEGFGWFRMYTRTLNNPKAQQLDGESFKGWVNLLCCAGIHGGVLPAPDALAFELRKSVPEVLSLCSLLVDVKLLDRSKGGKLVPHDWKSLQYKSDSSTDRVKKHRMKRFSNVPVTASEQIQSRAEQIQTAAALLPIQKLAIAEVRGKPLAAYPKTIEQVRFYFPATDDEMLGKIAAAAGYPEDELLVRAVVKAGKPNQRSAALFVRTVPEVLKSWA